MATATATATAATWQEWLRSQIDTGRTRGEALYDALHDDDDAPSVPADIFDNLQTARRALKGSGLGVAADALGLEFFPLDRLTFAQDCFDLLRANGNAMDANQLVRELRARGHDATVYSVFALPGVDCCIVGDEIPCEGFKLIKGARRPGNY